MSVSGVRRRVTIAGALASAGLLASAAVAVAAHQVHGATYEGAYKTGQTNAVSFKVAVNGSRVVDLDVDTPIKCGGGCGGFSNGIGGSAKITRKGTFTAKIKLTGPGSTRSIGYDKVTGTFLAGGHAKGTVSSHFDAGGGSDRTVAWTAAVLTQ